MAWRTIAAVATVIFLVVVLQSSMIGPLEQFSNSLSDTADGTLQNEHLDANTFETLPATWSAMGLIAIFGVMGWGAWRVVRRELTRGNL